MNTQGFVPDTINLIADNLRDRYANGFPILKELVQNADDAKAQTFAFGQHPGFEGRASHPLLQGPGIWFFNDGAFDHRRDKRALRSFGINSKAGESGTIGKFGLGMKSVFHLCEAFFYVAWDGTCTHLEILNPWKTVDDNIHPDWDGHPDTDGEYLTDLARGLAGDRPQWFLLWVPLRRRDHLLREGAPAAGAIIERFPGDDPTADLAFLRDQGLAQDLAAVLPLLRHLETIEHRGEVNPFVLRLQAGPRLIAERASAGETDGMVADAAGTPVLRFAGVRQTETGSWAQALKAAEKWPKSRYRDENGHDRIGEDKTRAEGAVLFCSGNDTARPANLHWAVFLPLEEGAEPLAFDGVKPRHSLVLHGQFFVDAGRRKVHDQQGLHQPTGDAHQDGMDEATLRQTWNRHLAQRVLAPMVISALDYYVRRQGLSDDECCYLTKALAESRWFDQFRGHVCGEDAWVRGLEQDGPCWRRMRGADHERLRPVPPPTKGDPGRPWAVFPRLEAMDLLPCDGKAPVLANCRLQWHEEELDALLGEVTGLFRDGPSMDYLEAFLCDQASRFLGSQRLQARLIGLLRSALKSADRSGRKRFAEKGKRLIDHVQPNWRLDLTADLPDRTLRELWSLDAPILLVPNGLVPSPGKAVPDDPILRNWLRVLDQAVTAADADGIALILDAIQGMLRPLDRERRGRFLRVHDSLRIIAVRDPVTGRDRAASGADVRTAREGGTLFGFAQGARERDRLGLTTLLAQAIPAAQVWLVRAETYQDIFPDEPRLSRADDPVACLAAVGQYATGGLGGLPKRQALLERANDPGADAIPRRGLRYLLHGSSEHRGADKEPLWFPGHGQDPAWAKLWDQLHGEETWSRIPAELADTLPRGRWDAAGVREIDARNLIEELDRTRQGIQSPGDLSPEERDEILAHIEREDLWMRLPLHTRLDDEPVTAAQGLVYLLPDQGLPDDPLFARATLIRRSQNPAVAQQQDRWLKPLDDHARIELALDTPDPATHWRPILDALGRIGTPLDPSLRQRIRSVAWLPTHQGPSVKPGDVIYLPAGLGDEARRLVGEHRNAAEPCYAVPSDLANDLICHPSWTARAQDLCATGDEALGQLGLLLAGLPIYRIGPWPGPPDSKTVALLSGCPELPGWRLLMRVLDSETQFDRETAWDRLRKGLRGTLEPKRLRATLQWLSAEATDWKVRKGGFDCYLGWYTQAVLADSVDFVLPRLANRREEWCDPVDLCVGVDGADTGIDLSRLLDPRQTELLADLVSRAGGIPEAKTAFSDRQQEIDHRLFSSARDKTPKFLDEYFASWSQLVPTPMIGVLIALLEPHSPHHAEEYLAPHSFDWLLDQLDEAGGDSIVEQMERLQVAVHVIAERSINAINLLGEPITVPLDQNLQTLLAGPLSQKRTYRVQVPLRKIDITLFTAEELMQLLRRTAESLCADIYPPRRCLKQLWTKLDNSNQLEVSAARRKILHYMPRDLRQLSLSHDEIEKALLAHDKAFTAFAETAGDGRNAVAQRNLDTAITAIANAIVNDRSAQAAVLEGVRDKLRKFQYDPSSILFELFQNADDAAVELGQIEPHPDRESIPPGARRVVVELDNEALRFLHWGRPINDRGPVGFDGERRGFGRDLEKMLVLSDSDKRPDQGVTGKFGLGFKSVLLACDRPQIVSGRLAFSVIAGILPQPWDEAAVSRDALTRHASPGQRLPGTVIDLPGIDSTVRMAILERFQPLAGLLCVFAQAVRSIRLCEGSEEQDLAWKSKAVVPGAEIGQLHLRDDTWGNETDALCLRTRSGAVVLALGPGGFRLLPKWTPSLWVTAPMRETDGLGFACTSAFDLDVGRARLAGDSKRNLTVAQGLGAEAGKVLSALFERGKSDWTALRQDLGLDQTLNPHDLWHGLWNCLTERWLTGSKVGAAALARALALALLQRLTAGPGTVPNGLTGPFQAMIDLGDALYQLPKALASSKAISVLGTWERFTVKYPRRHLVSEGQGRVLKEGGMAKPVALGLTALVALVDPPKVTPEDSDALGGIRLLMEEDRDWVNDDIKKRLRALRFRTASDTWEEAARLVAGGGKGIEKDEALRYALAPDDRRLHPSYWEGGDELEARVSFFVLARERLQASTDDLVNWVLAANTTAAKQAALVYLSDGELGQAVAERVKAQDWLPVALYNQDLLAGLKHEQIQRLQGRLASAVQLQQIWQTSTSRPLLQRGLDLATALSRIANWWAKNGISEARQYRQKLFPSGNIKLALDTQTGGFDRSSWLALFALGAFQGMGRTREAQHKGFIEHCTNKGWWQTFADLDPKAHPERWMDVIEEYAEEQHDEEEWTQWIAQFPKLYRFRRWMDDYVDLFLSIDRFDEPFGLNALLAPRTNPHFQGGGIEAPPLTRILRVGGPLVIRELLYHGVISNPLAVPHAYAPIQRIRGWFETFGVTVDTSNDIHALLCAHLDEVKATFGGAYDIPLRIVTADEDLQGRLLR